MESVEKNFFTTAADGKNYSTNFYNLDAIISVGYRVKSVVAMPGSDRPTAMPHAYTEDQLVVQPATVASTAWADGVGGERAISPESHISPSGEIWQNTEISYF